MVVILILLAILLAGAGIFSISQATLGVGLLAVACFLGILARIAQAAKHQEKTEVLLEELKNIQGAGSSPTPYHPV